MASLPTSGESAYTPLENWLLLRGVGLYGPKPSSWSSISAELLRNPLVCAGKTSVEEERLSAEALRSHFEKLLEEAERDGIHGGANTNGSGVGGGGIGALSNGSMDNDQRARLINQMSARLKETYVADTICQIRYFEQVMTAASKDKQDIQEGKWDEKLVKEEMVRREAAAHSAQISREGSMRISPAPAADKSRAKPDDRMPAPSRVQVVVPAPPTQKPLEPVRQEKELPELRSPVPAPAPAPGPPLQGPVPVAAQQQNKQIPTSQKPLPPPPEPVEPSPPPPAPPIVPAHASPPPVLLPPVHFQPPPAVTSLPPPHPPPQPAVVNAPQPAPRPSPQVVIPVKPPPRPVSLDQLPARGILEPQAPRHPETVRPISREAIVSPVVSTAPHTPVRSRASSQSYPSSHASPAVTRVEAIQTPQLPQTPATSLPPLQLSPATMDSRGQTPPCPILPPLSHRSIAGTPHPAQLPSIPSQQQPPQVEIIPNPLSQLADVAHGRWQQERLPANGGHRTPFSATPPSQYGYQPALQSQYAVPPQQQHPQAPLGPPIGAGPKGPGNYSILVAPQQSAPPQQRQLPMPQPTYPQTYYQRPPPPPPQHSPSQMVFTPSPGRPLHRTTFPEQAPIPSPGKPPHIVPRPPSLSPRQGEHAFPRPPPLLAPAPTYPNFPSMEPRMPGTPPRPGSADISPISTPSVSPVSSPKKLPSARDDEGVARDGDVRGKKRDIDRMEPAKTRSPARALPTEDRPAVKRAKSAISDAEEGSPEPKAKPSRRGRGRGRGGRGGRGRATETIPVDSPSPSGEKLDKAAAALVPSPPTPPPPQQSATSSRPPPVPVPSVSTTMEKGKARAEEIAPLPRQPAEHASALGQDSDMEMPDVPAARGRRKSLAGPPLPSTPTTNKRKRVASPSPPPSESDRVARTPSSSSANPFTVPKLEHQHSYPPSLILTSLLPSHASQQTVAGQQPMVHATKKFAHLSQSLLANIGGHRYANLFSSNVSEKNAPGYNALIYSPQSIKQIKSAVRFGAAQLPTAPRTPSNAATPTTDTPPALPAPGSGGGAGVTPAITLPATTFNTPPRAIVNSDQLEKEMFRMFANAAMYNKSGSEIHDEAVTMAHEVVDMIDNFKMAEEAGTKKAMERERKRAREGSGDWTLAGLKWDVGSERGSVREEESVQEGGEEAEDDGETEEAGEAKAGPKIARTGQGGYRGGPKNKRKKKLAAE